MNFPVTGSAIGLFFTSIQREVSIDPANRRREFHGLTCQITLRTLAAGFFPANARVKALPAAPAIFVIAATVDAFGSEYPLELVRTLGIHDEFVNGAAGEFGNRAIAGMVERQIVFIGLASADVARVRDDAEHRRIRECIDSHAFEPAPAAVAMTEAVLEAVQVGLRLAGREKSPEPLAHGVDIVGMEEFGGVTA